jgi:hypothetical protein
VIEPPSDQNGDVIKPQGSQFHRQSEIQYNFYSRQCIELQQGGKIQPLRTATDCNYAVQLVTSDRNVRNVQCVLRVKGCYLEFRQKVVVRWPENEFNDRRAMMVERIDPKEGLHNGQKFGILLEDPSLSFVKGGGHSNENGDDDANGEQQQSVVHRLYVDPLHGSDNYVKVQVAAGRHKGRTGFIRQDQKLQGEQTVFFETDAIASATNGGGGRGGGASESYYDDGIERFPSLELDQATGRVGVGDLKFLGDLTARPGSETEQDVGGHWATPFKTFARARRAARKRGVSAFVVLKMRGQFLDFRHAKDKHSKKLTDGRLMGTHAGGSSTKLGMTTGACVGSDSSPHERTHSRLPFPLPFPPSLFPSLSPPFPLQFFLSTLQHTHRRPVRASVRPSGDVQPRGLSHPQEAPHRARLSRRHWHWHWHWRGVAGAELGRERCRRGPAG